MIDFVVLLPAFRREVRCSEEMTWLSQSYYTSIRRSYYWVILLLCIRN